MSPSRRIERVDASSIPRSCRNVNSTSRGIDTDIIYPLLSIPSRVQYEFDRYSGGRCIISPMARVILRIEGYRCERCGHEWLPRRKDAKPPRVCPLCKSPYWDVPRKSPKPK